MDALDFGSGIYTFQKIILTIATIILIPIAVLGMFLWANYSKDYSAFIYLAFSLSLIFLVVFTIYLRFKRKVIGLFDKLAQDLNAHIKRGQLDGTYCGYPFKSRTKLVSGIGFLPMHFTVAGLFLAVNFVFEHNRNLSKEFAVYYTRRLRYNLIVEIDEIKKIKRRINISKLNKGEDSVEAELSHALDSVIIAELYNLFESEGLKFHFIFKNSELRIFFDQPIEDKEKVLAVIDTALAILDRF